MATYNLKIYDITATVNVDAIALSQITTTLTLPTISVRPSIDSINLIVGKILSVPTITVTSHESELNLIRGIMLTI